MDSILFLKTRFLSMQNGTLITEMQSNGQLNVGVTELEISTIYPNNNHMLFGKEIHSPSWILQIKSV